MILKINHILGHKTSFNKYKENNLLYFTWTQWNKIKNQQLKYKLENIHMYEGWKIYSWMTYGSSKKLRRNKKFLESNEN
jgi:hypothetical protein